MDKMTSLKRFIILQYSSFLLLVIMVAMQCLIGSTKTLGYAFELALVITVGYILLIMLYISVASTSKFLVWSTQGYLPSVFMFFPVIVQIFPRFKLMISINPLNYIEEFYSAKLMNNLDSSLSLKQVEKMYKRTLYSGVISKLIISFITLIILLLFQQYIYILVLIIFTYTMFDMDRLQLHGFHGDLVKVKYVKKGLGFFYFAEKAILYNKSFYIYEEFQKNISNIYLEHPELRFKTVKILEHIYLINTLNNSIPVSGDMLELISKEALDDEAANLYSKIGQEQWDLIKVLLCYSLINDADLLVRVNQKMVQLSIEWNGRIGDTISWYVKIGRYKSITKQTKLIKNTVIRHSILLFKFTNYYKVVKGIEDKIYEICKIEL